jgi:hypothetical protein
MVGALKTPLLSKAPDGCWTAAELGDAVAP